jgi:hypothetical protein
VSLAVAAEPKIAGLRPANLEDHLAHARTKVRILGANVFNNVPFLPCFNVSFLPCFPHGQNGTITYILASFASLLIYAEIWLIASVACSRGCFCKKETPNGGDIRGVNDV